jgi:hypothetical protein
VTFAEARVVARSLGRVSGFALPAAVFALVVVGVLVTGGILLATQESRIGQATERGSQAFYVAESGMNTVLSTYSPGASTLTVWGSTDSISGTSPQGDWDAEVRRVDDRLFFVVTTGNVPAPVGSEASRTLGVLARVLTVELAPPAALVTRGNVSVRGSAQIRGEDQNPAGWGPALCPEPLQDLPGVITDVSTPPRTVTTQGSAVVSGVPQAHVQDPNLNAESFQEFGDSTWEDLTAIATIQLPGGNHNNMGPTLTASGACNYADPLNWGDPNDPSGACGAYFPIIHIAGDASLQSNGRGQGILLVDGDLDLRGSFHFYGIIIVQGQFGVQGGGQNAPRVSGGVMSANLAILGDTLVDGQQSFVGSSIVRNSRCAVRRAVQNNSSLNRLAPLADRGWVDITGASF